MRLDQRHQYDVLQKEHAMKPICMNPSNPKGFFFKKLQGYRESKSLREIWWRLFFFSRLMEAIQLTPFSSGIWENIQKIQCDCLKNLSEVLYTMRLGGDFIVICHFRKGFRPLSQIIDYPNHRCLGIFLLEVCQHGKPLLYSSSNWRTNRALAPSSLYLGHLFHPCIIIIIPRKAGLIILPRNECRDAL